MTDHPAATVNREPAPARQTALDVLRLFSALLVIVFHYGFRMAISGEGGGVGFPELSTIAIWCDSGVLIFFAISGYVIALSAEGRTAYDFAVSRFARLWPAFVVCATLTAGIVWLYPIPGVPQPTVAQWIAQFVMISRLVGQPFIDGAYWTIAYEIIFYGWVALFIATGWFASSWRLLILVWIAISIANEAVIGSNAIRKLMITEYSGYFGFGIALYKSQQMFDRKTAALLALTMAWGTLSRICGDAGFTTLYGVSRTPLDLALISPLPMLLVAGAVRIGNAPLPERFAVALGALTYPLYLLHQHIGYAAFANFGSQSNRWIVAGITVLALLAAAHVIASRIEPAGRRIIKAVLTKYRPAWPVFLRPANQFNGRSERI